MSGHPLDFGIWVDSLPEEIANWVKEDSDCGNDCIVVVETDGMTEHIYDSCYGTGTTGEPLYRDVRYLASHSPAKFSVFPDFLSACKFVDKVKHTTEWDSSFDLPF